MKQGIHPQYVEATVHCSCGETFETRATQDHIRVEICSKCHPFFTGKQKFVDSGGRVQRFQDKFGAYKAPEKPAKDAEEASASEGPAREVAPEEAAQEAAQEVAPEEVAPEEEAAEEPVVEEAPVEASGDASEEEAAV